MWRCPLESPPNPISAKTSSSSSSRFRFFPADEEEEAEFEEFDDFLDAPVVDVCGCWGGCCWGGGGCCPFLFKRANISCFFFFMKSSFLFSSARASFFFSTSFLNRFSVFFCFLRSISFATFFSACLFFPITADEEEVVVEVVEVVEGEVLSFFEE